MISINMLSKADSVQGHGVLTAHDEQVALIKESLGDIFTVYENAKFGCDINHFHTLNVPYFFKLPITRLSGITVGYVHFLPETLEKSLHLPAGIKELVYWYIMQFYKSMDYLVTVNPSFIDKLCSYGIPREKISYIPNFVSSERFHKIDGFDKDSLKSEYGIPLNHFTVLSVGQLQKRKGVLEFIELAKAMPDIQFVWAGGFSFGKMSDGYETIKAAMEKPPENVHFIGIIGHERMNELYNMCDLMFQPSFEELFPMTILEAMSCGIPLLLRSLPEYEPILQGFYLKGNSTEAFKASIEGLQQSGLYQTACQMSRSGSNLYTKERVRDLWKRYYCAVYNEGKIKNRLSLRVLHRLAVK